MIGVEDNPKAQYAKQLTERKARLERQQRVRLKFHMPCILMAFCLLLGSAHVDLYPQPQQPEDGPLYFAVETLRHARRLAVLGSGASQLQQ